MKMKCYSLNEILSEKTRAIFERNGLSRDIYDVVNISKEFKEHISADEALKSLKEKFKFKLLPTPSVERIMAKIDFEKLKSDWDNQLKHQVQNLASAKSYYEALKPALSWWIN